MTQHAIEWVDGIAGYRARAAEPDGRVLVVIAPDDPGRRRRWQHVLEWYLERAPPGPAARDPQTTDLVLSVGDAFRTPAELYARSRGRRLLHVDASGTGIERAVSEGHWSSVLVVGATSCLDRSLLLRLAASRVPWGAVTALDVAGASFAVAKLIAASRVAGTRAGVLDVLAGTAVAIGTEPLTVRKTRLAPEAVGRTALGAGWDRLALVAHGEAGHLNLESAVLCGLLGSRETGPAGALIDGCRIDGETITCKRSNRDGVPAHAYGDLRAVDLGLFSCASAVLGDELYPSAVSGVLSAAEGFPARVIAIDRLLTIEDWEPIAAMYLLGRGVGAGHVASLLNDVRERRTGDRPYLIFGDPAGLPVPIVTVDVGCPVDVGDPGLVVVARSDGRAAAEVGRLEPVQPSSALVAVSRSLAVLLTSRAHAPPVRILDAAPRLAARTRWFEAMGGRLTRAAHLERVVARAAGAGPDAAAEALHGWRAVLESEIHAGLDRCEQARFMGIWDESIERHAASCSIAIQRWDEVLATRLADDLITDVPDVLGHGLRRSTLSARGICGHCGGALDRIALSSPLADQPDQLVSECRFCATFVVVRDGAQEPQVRVDGPLTPGTVAKLDVVAPDDLVDLPDGRLVVDVRDSGLGWSFYRFHEQVGSLAAALDVAVPEGVSPDLHTLRVAWVRGLDVSVVWQRWAAFRYVEAPAAPERA